MQELLVLYVCVRIMTHMVSNNAKPIGVKKMSKQIEIKKLQKVDAPAEFLDVGVVAFQLVQITISYFGNVMEGVYDTRILADGRQFVIDGDGFIPEGFEVVA